MLKTGSEVIASLYVVARESKVGCIYLNGAVEKNPHCYAEKRIWVEKHSGMTALENLIISPHKHLNKGAYLIDDMPSGKGQEYFEGQLILFASEELPNWASVTRFIKSLIGTVLRHPRPR